MVKVVEYQTRTNELGENFNVLIVQGGVEPIKSKSTGKLYFSSKKASVPCTFDESICQELLGTSFEGSISKVSCESYEYIIEETGEQMVLDYRYEYTNEALDIVENQLIEQEAVT